MIQRVALFWLIGSTAAAAATAKETLVNLYLAPNGRDEWSGKFSEPNRAKTNGPFATLERARDEIRKLRADGRAPSVTVWIRGGVYERTQPFRLTSEDSGSEESPVVYRAWQNESPRFLGGRIVRGFTPVTDPDVLTRFSEEAREKVLQLDLAAHGIENLGRFSRRGFGGRAAPAHLELFFGGRRMAVARWPNDGWTHIAAIVEGGASDGHGGEVGRLTSGFYYEGDRPARWKNLQNVWLHGYWAWDWANSYEQLAEINAETRLLKTKAPHGVYGFRKGQRFYFLNVLEELDAPGEYYVDRDAGKLYFWPPEPIEKQAAAVSVLERPLIQLQNVSHTQFIGLTFEISRGHGIEVNGGENVLIAGCTLRNLGNYGVVVNAGVRHRVVSSDVYHTGDGGIQINGGDRKTLTPARHEVINTHIHRFAEWSRTYQPAVLITGVGNRIAHCRIHDGPHNAILLGGNEHVIELNDISRVCLETGDAGAFYMGRDYTQRGNVIRHNYFHHLSKVGGLQAETFPEVMAVYLDDNTSGITVFGNVFYKAGRAVFIGGGRDNVVENNVFVDCDPAVAIDGRGLDKSPTWQNQIYKDLKPKLDAMRPHEAPYRERYPELLDLDKYYAADGGVPPENNRIARNVCVGRWLHIYWHATGEMMDIRDNLTETDPRFVAVERRNFELRPESPAWALGFQRIPWEKIGLYRDEYRQTLPH